MPSLCFLIGPLQFHFILSYSPIKSLEFTEHFQVERGVPPSDEGLSVIFIEPPASMTALRFPVLSCILYLPQDQHVVFGGDVEGVRERELWRTASLLRSPSAEEVRKEGLTVGLSL